MTESADQAKSLLLPALLAMDVYHRDEKGGLRFATPNAGNIQVNNLERSLDTATPLGKSDLTSGEPGDIGFFAKTYTVGDKIYLVYCGTDDGSLDVLNNPRQIGSTLVSEFTGATPIVPDLYYGYPMAIGALSSLNIADASSPTGYNSQAIQAVRYYKQVRDANPNKEIVIVGQSLGGGLAAFVGSLDATGNPTETATTQARVH
jgi:hypothetical protein